MNDYCFGRDTILNAIQVKENFHNKKKGYVSLHSHANKHFSLHSVFSHFPSLSLSVNLSSPPSPFPPLTEFTGIAATECKRCNRLAVTNPVSAGVLRTGGGEGGWGDMKKVKGGRGGRKGMRGREGSEVSEPIRVTSLANQ